MLGKSFCDDSDCSEGMKEKMKSGEEAWRCEMCLGEV